MDRIAGIPLLSSTIDSKREIALICERMGVRRRRMTDPFEETDKPLSPSDKSFCRLYYVLLGARVIARRGSFLGCSRDIS